MKKIVSFILSIVMSSLLLFSDMVSATTYDDPYIVPIDFSIAGLGCPSRPKLFLNENDTNEPQNREPIRDPLPTSVDLSTDPAFPPIGNQGSIGSCSAWATTYYTYTYMVHKAKGITSTSNNSYSPRWTNNMLNGGENVGYYADEAFEVLKYQGALTMAQYPYSVNGYYSYSWSTNTQAMIDALSTRVSSHSYYSVPCSYNVNFQMDLSSIKRDLNNNKPLVASLKSLSGLTNGTCKQCSDSSHYGQWIYVRNARTSSSGDITTGHTVAVVGYDDSVWCDVNENNIVDTGETGAFKIANSWGTGFGNAGYAWVLYDALLATSRIKSANNSSVTWDHAYSTVRYPFFTYDDTDYYTNTFYYCSISDYTVGYISELTVSTNRRNQLKAWSAYKYSSAAYTNDIPIYPQIGNVDTDIGFSGTLVLNHPSSSNIAAYLSGYNFGFRLEDRLLDGNAISGISCKIVDNLENTISNVYSGNYLDGSSIVETVPINLARGDVDYSGVLTVSDADTIIDYIAHLVDFSNVQRVLADYNQDGYVDVSDAVAIKVYLANRGDDVSEIEIKLQHYLCTGLIKYAN